MDEAVAGPSQEPSSSQSFRITETPGSPDILDPDSPDRAEREPRNSSQRDQHESETYTQNEENVRSSAGEVNNLPQVFITGATDDNSNDSDATVYLSDDNTRSSINNDNAIQAGPSRTNVEVCERCREIYHPSEESLSSLPDRGRIDTDEPPMKMIKLTQDEELDGETCPICLDTWGNSGEHRLVALKCGHLFGSQCVERWLQAQPIKNRSCPTCKSKTSMKDIRPIYARKLVAADTSEITTLKKQIDMLQADKARTELELQKTRIAHRSCVMQLDVLRGTLLKQTCKEQPVRKSWRFSLEKNMEVAVNAMCRVLAYNCRTYELYVSHRSTNHLFPGFGIRKVNCVDYKMGQFIHLHSKQIRDITYSQPRDLLLSVGFDNSARIVERDILNTTVQTTMQLWSCSWDNMRSNEFYVGGVDGSIYHYDIRNPGAFLSRLQAPGDRTPVISLCSTEYGLLSCQLNSCWVWMRNPTLWEPQSFPIEGPFLPLSYDSESHRVLISCRARENGERSRLAVFKLKASLSTGDLIVDSDQVISASAVSTYMSRAAWVKAPGATWIAAHSESDSALYLHGLDGTRTISLPTSDRAIDECSFQLNGTLVASLSDSRLRVYKAISTSF